LSKHLLVRKKAILAVPAALVQMSETVFIFGFSEVGYNKIDFLVVIQLFSNYGRAQFWKTMEHVRVASNVSACN
jgi:hypothetical protein